MKHIKTWQERTQAKKGPFAEAARDAEIDDLRSALSAPPVDAQPVASIDTPDFWKLASEWRNCDKFKPSTEQAKALIAHINAHTAAQVAASKAPVAVPDDVSYEIVQDDIPVASASGKDAMREIRHYAAQYMQDGPIEVFKVERTKIDLAAPTTDRGE